MKKNKAGNDEKGMWGRREVTIQSIMAPWTCPMSKDLKEGRVAPHAYLGKRIPGSGVQCQSPKAGTGMCRRRGS